MQSTLFNCYGYLPFYHAPNDQDNFFDIGTLPPFLRTILTSDGTVTKSLEAFFWEPVDVELISQQDKRAFDIPFEDMLDDENILQRRVKIIGRNSKRCYLAATSYIRLDWLPNKVKDNLFNKSMSIGRSLRENNIATSRQIVAIQSNFKDDSVDEERRKSCVERYYRVMMGNICLMVIKESYPIAVYTA